LYNRACTDYRIYITGKREWRFALTKEEATLKIIDYAIKGARFGGTYDDPVGAVHEVMTLCEIAEIIDSELEEGN
jgi:hypothetical protein